MHNKQFEPIFNLHLNCHPTQLHVSGLAVLHLSTTPPSASNIKAAIKQIHIYNDYFVITNNMVNKFFFIKICSGEDKES